MKLVLLFLFALPSTSVATVSNPGGTSPHAIKRWPLGFMFAGLASVMSVLGIQLMHAGVHKTTRALSGEDQARRATLDRLWFGGVALHIFAAVLIALALNFAALSMVMPMASLTLAIHSLCVPALNGAEWLNQNNSNWSAVKGSAVCLLGAFFMVVSAQKFNTAFSVRRLEQLFQRPEFVAFELLCIFFMGVLFFLGKTQPRRHHGRRGILLMFFSVSAGWAGAQQYLCMKCLMEIWKSEHLGKGPWVSVTSIVILVTSLILCMTQILLVNTALKVFANEVVRFVGVYQACSLTIGCISGGVYFQEFSHFKESQWAGFCCGLFLMVWGIGIITLLRGETNDRYVNTAEDRKTNCGSVFIYWICGPYRVLFRTDPEFLPHAPGYTEDLSMSVEFDKIWGRSIIW